MVNKNRKNQIYIDSKVIDEIRWKLIFSWSWWGSVLERLYDGHEVNHDVLLCTNEPTNLRHSSHSHPPSAVWATFEFLFKWERRALATAIFTTWKLIKTKSHRPGISRCFPRLCMNMNMAGDQMSSLAVSCVLKPEMAWNSFHSAECYLYTFHRN